MNTIEIKAALETYYAKPAFALLWEVGNGTGMNCSRHADAIAMSLLRLLVCRGRRCKDYARW